MYVKNKKYYDRKEYVRDLISHYGYVEPTDSDVKFLLTGALFLAVMAVGSISLQECESLSGAIFTFFFTIGILVAIPYVYKKSNEKNKKMQLKYISLYNIFEEVPKENRCRDVDQVFADLVMENTINEKTVIALRNARRKCFKGGCKYHIYALEMDKVNKSLGRKAQFEGFIKDSYREEAEKRAALFDEKEKQATKIWKKVLKR